MHFLTVLVFIITNMILFLSFVSLDPWSSVIFLFLPFSNSSFTSPPLYLSLFIYETIMSSVIHSLLFCSSYPTCFNVSESISNFYVLRIVFESVWYSCLNFRIFYSNNILYHIPRIPYYLSKYRFKQFVWKLFTFKKVLNVEYYAHYLIIGLLWFIYSDFRNNFLSSSR